MSLYRVDAIIIKAQDLGEADRLITSYTRQRGRHRAVARGARRPRSRLAAGVQPFVYSELLCWRGRTLDGISQCAVKAGHRPLRETLEGMAAASFACELVDAFAQEDDADPRAFDLLAAGLRTLGEQVSRGRVSGGEGRDARAGAAVDAAAAAAGTILPVLRRVLASIQWKLLAVKGFRPVLDACAACGRPLTIPGNHREDYVPAAGARRLAFSPAEGGLLCGPCRAGGDPSVVEVGPAALRVVDYLIRRPLAAAANLQADPAVEGEMTAVGRVFLAWVLEKRLRSPDFLDLLTVLGRF